MISISVDIEPQTKKRPKVYRWSTVNPSKQDEEELAKLVRKHPNCPKVPLSEQIRIKLKFYKKAPKNTPKWKYDLMEKGLIRPNINPDLDNYVKLVLDALNGILWEDDRMIVEFHSGKYYSIDRPRIEIMFDEVPQINLKKDAENIKKYKSEDLDEFFN